MWTQSISMPRSSTGRSTATNPLYALHLLFILHLIPKLPKGVHVALYGDDIVL
jgi:hypothetical protein